MLISVLALLALPAAAHAAFPGQNGRIAFGANAIETINPDGTGRAPLFADSTSFREIGPEWSPAGDKVLFERFSCSPSLCFPQGAWTVNADGSGLQQVPNLPSQVLQPAWAPDGQRFVYASQQNGFETGLDLYAVGLDGINPVRLTSALNHDFTPAWSPDGTKIAFISTRDGPVNGPGELYVMNADGSGQTRLTSSTGAEGEPNWSPDGSRIAFDVVENGRSVWSIKPDGTELTRLSPSTHFLFEPAWSPDGSRIAARGNQINTSQNDLILMNADGTGPTPITNDAAAESDPDWQPLPTPYPRPKGATPLRVTLVPAYPFCPSSNRTHGPPLAFGSCSPPAQESGQLTVGTGDANGAPTNMTGFVRYDSILGDPATPADEADLALRVEVTDVRVKDTLADYAGEVEAQAQTRMTDHEGAIAATAADVRFPLTTQCAPTASTTIGSTCSLTTTLDTLIPGAVVEKARTMLQLGQVRVVDGGPDGDTATEPNTVFLRQGVFVP